MCFVLLVDSLWFQTQSAADEDEDEEDAEHGDVSFS